MTKSTIIPVKQQHTFRQTIKNLFENLGILPLFLFLRNCVSATIIFITLLPMRILITPALLYMKAMWRINPDLKLIKDYFPNLVGEQKSTVHHKVKGKDFTFKFYTPNSICQFRADSLLTKEPETLEWMNEFGNGGVLFDIGANVGVYSVYHAVTQNATVYAFEPSVFNLPILAKNINANNLQSKIKIVTNPLTSENGFANFKLPNTVSGGALSGFGVDYGHDGKPLKTTVSYDTYGFSLDHLISTGAIKETPTLIKLDVDGIEHLILEGAKKTISDPACKSILVEINGNFVMQDEKVKEILTSCGFSFKYKKRAAHFDLQGEDVGTFNNIWVKN